MENTQPDGQQAIVVTNDFETNTPQEEVKAALAPTKTQEEDGDEGETTNDTDPSKVKKPTNGYKKKNERLLAENERLRQQLASGIKPIEVVKAPVKVEDGKPKASDFKTQEDYVEALAAHKAKETVSNWQAEQDKKQREAKMQEEFKGKLKTYEDKKAAAVEAHEDYDEVVSQFDDVPVNPALHGALLDADDGPELAYYLASNPDVFEDLNKPHMTALDINRKLAKIEAKLELSKENPKPAEIKQVSKAPEPVKPVVKGKGTSTFDPNTADPDDYIAHRWKERNGNR